MDSVTPVQIVLAVAGLVTLAGYLAFVVAPAWTSYGRLWERCAAGFLTLFILASLLGFGAAIGISLVWFYDRYA